ncbi:MAG: PQQ-binding-like beta-propeller repeat protein [Phycisphaerae bacterium]
MCLHHLLRAWPVVVICLGSTWATKAEPPILDAESLRQVGYGVFWDSSLPSGNDPVFSAHLLDENLYVITKLGVIYAVQADTGLLRWARQLDETVYRDRAPTHVATPSDDGPVLFVTHSKVTAFDRYSGETFKELQLPFPAGGGAVADGFLMYVGSAGGEFYTLRWLCDPRCIPLTRAHVDVNGVITSQPIAAFGRIYFTTSVGEVYCVEPGGKVLRWAYATGGEVSSGIQVDDSGVYVASTNRRLYVLDPDTGRRIRSYRFPGPLFDRPAVVQRTCYQYCPPDGLFAFDVDTRRRLWVRPDAREFVARAAENLVLLTTTGDLMFAENQTGQVRGILDLPEDVIAVTNTRDNVLYLVGRDGGLLCAKPTGFDYLRRDTVTTARARLGLSPRAVQATLAGLATGPLTTGAATAAAVDDPLRSKTGP